MINMGHLGQLIVIGIEVDAHIGDVGSSADLHSHARSTLVLSLLLFKFILFHLLDELAHSLTIHIRSLLRRNILAIRYQHVVFLFFFVHLSLVIDGKIGFA